MPVVSSIFNVPDFRNMFVVLKEPDSLEGVNMNSLDALREAGGAAFAYGNFINALIAFILVAIALFFVVKAINKAKREEVVEEPAPTGPTTEDLLGEIRDLLAKK